MKRRVFSVILLLIAAIFPCAFAEESFSSNPDAIEKAAQSVLMLEVFDADDKLIGTGSGFVAFDNRTIVTNYHVIDGAAWVRANSDLGYQYMVTKVLIADEEKDLAICSFMSPTDLMPLELDADRQLRRAESIVAIGSPIGITNTVSLGNISALYEDTGISWIQFTAPISSGSSGGALFGDNGAVIGVTSASYIDTQNLNLAVHASEIECLYQKWNGQEVGFTEYLTMISVTPSPEPTSTPTPTPVPTVTPGPTIMPTSKPIATLKPKSATTIVTYETLRIGDSGEAVTRLQQALIDLGYLNDTADGVFGKKTGEAVRLFNIQHNSGEFESDAVAWNTMQQLLFSDQAKPLHISKETHAEWEVVKDNMYPRKKLRLHFQIVNRSKTKTITKIEYVVWAEDAKGNIVSSYQHLSTAKEISPASTEYSYYVSFMPPEDIFYICCALERVTYLDGEYVDYTYDNDISKDDFVVLWKVQ